MLKSIRIWITLIALIALFVQSGCNPSAPASPAALSPGNYTPLGGVQKNNQPTTSDYADLQAAESGTLNQPALVEFYADY
ncbi:MAG: hypothetical protein WCF84_18910 [Anaerolineae bacterium]